MKDSNYDYEIGNINNLKNNLSPDPRITTIEDVEAIEIKAPSTDKAQIYKDSSEDK